MLGSDAAVLDRLAVMPQLEYERVRGEEAKKLGIKRIKVLDALVAKRRAEIEAEDSDGPMAEVKPWHDAVDGQELLGNMTGIFPPLRRLAQARGIRPFALGCPCARA
jgi:hypothetical protein